MRETKIQKLLRILRSPKDFALIIMAHTSPLWPDELYLRAKFRLTMGKSLNLKNPNTFNEKLQWLKLYDRKPEYTTMVDKYAAKDYVAKIIGKEHIIQNLGLWERAEDIEWDKLPNQFVLKCTHDSGGVVICRDKNNFDKDKSIKILTKSLRHNFYSSGREWPYKDAERKIFAEEYLEDEFGELRDYKWFCFDGVVKALFIATDRSKGDYATRFDFFDDKFNHLPFTNGHPNADVPPEKPKMFEKMKELASSLSKGIPQVRVDFYEVNGRVFFGEMTFFHWSGFMPFDPEEWDVKFGNWIKLPVH